MTEIDKQRILFIEQLHETFLRKKGYGALAYIALPDMLNLFEQFLKSGDSADHFINQLVKSV